MHNFKVGDDIWYFTFPEDGCGGFDVNDIQLNHEKIKDEKHLTYPYLHYCYHTRKNAIDAMTLKILCIEWGN